VIAVDTSVVIAAFAPWHDAHEVALAVVTPDVRLPAHCALESYSTLTRLPDPFRVSANLAAGFLRRVFESRWLFPNEHELGDLPDALASAGIAGGATYDGLVGVTVRSHGARLLSLDRRAALTYRLLDVEHDILDG
jgi:predicted nucleic acid-binding protein